MQLLISATLLFAGPVAAQIDTRINPPDDSGAAGQADSGSGDITSQQPAGGVLDPLTPVIQLGLNPGVSLSEAAQNHAFGQPVGSGFSEISRATGFLSYAHQWKSSLAQAQYSGGVNFYDQQPGVERYFNLAGLSDVSTLGRWTVTLGAHYSYTPASAFGFAAANNISSSQAGLNPNVTSGPSILAQLRSQTTELGTGQAGYSFTPSSSLHVSGLYSQSLAKGGTIAKTTMANGQARYTKMVGRASLGFSYTHSQLSFPATSATIVSDSPSVSLGRPLFSTITITASGGPQITQVSHTAAPVVTSIRASGSVAVAYVFGRGQLTVGFNKGVSNGSGVLQGSQMTHIYLDLNRRFSQSWILAVAAAYARNNSLVGQTTALTQNYDSTFITPTLNRQFGQRVSMFLAYSFMAQLRSGGGCSAGGCVSYPATHIFTLGLDLHFRQGTNPGS